MGVGCRAFATGERRSHRANAAELSFRRRLPDGGEMPFDSLTDVAVLSEGAAMPSGCQLPPDGGPVNSMMSPATVIFGMLNRIR